MKKRMYRARRRMNHVIRELSHALLLAGRKALDMRLPKEENGLRLPMDSALSTEHQRHMEHMATLIPTKFRYPPVL